MIYCFLQKEIDNNRKIAFMSVIRCRSCLFVLADFIRNFSFLSVFMGIQRDFRHKKSSERGI